MPVALINHHPRVKASLETHCRRTSLLLLRYCGVPLHHLTVVLTTDTDIAELNQRYRTKDGPTNVLRFPFADTEDPLLSSLAPPTLGDVVISAGLAHCSWCAAFARP